MGACFAQKQLKDFFFCYEGGTPAYRFETAVLIGRACLSISVFRVAYL